MKNRLLTTFFITCCLLLLPRFAFADPNFDDLATVLISAFVILVALVIMSIVFTVIFLTGGRKYAFYLALIPALIVFIAISFILSWSGGQLGLFGLWLLIPLGIIGLLAFKQVKNKTTALINYVVMNEISLQIFWVFIAPVSWQSGDATILQSIFKAVGIAIYCLFTFLFTKALLQSVNKNKHSDIYLKVNIYVALSFILGLLLGFLRMPHLADYLQSFVPNIKAYLLALIPYIIACNITAFITIKFFSDKKIDEEVPL